MKIHMYGIVWNETKMLPFFFRHYDQIVERYFLFDDGSTDGTREMLTAHPRVSLRELNIQDDSVCGTARTIKSEAWKESRTTADLVLVCDVDELLWHPCLHEYLQSAIEEGVTFFCPSGWNMVSEVFPQSEGHIYEQVRHGFRTTAFDKKVLFNPQMINEINYTPGCHTCQPEGEIVRREDPQLKLLHFKYLGVPYVTERYAALNAKLRGHDRTQKWGEQYGMNETEVARMFAAFQPIDAFAEG
ncbi:MAG: glycosyltransferase family 2 protein [Planctomycetota bacterium]